MTDKRLIHTSSMRSSATRAQCFTLLPHLDAIDDAAFDQVFERPGQVLRADAVHRGAEAAGIVERDDALAFARQIGGPGG